MSKRRHKHEEHEEHVNHERWLVTYADMITLLMVLFIVLFAMGQTDLAKYKKLKHSLTEGFGGSDKLALIDGGAGDNAIGGSGGLTPHELAADAALAAQDQKVVAWQVEKKKLENAAAALQKALSDTVDPVVSDPQITVSLQSRGLIITINSDAVLFAPGSASLRPDGQEILDRIAPQLVALDNTIVVEGHTDNVPISGTYPSNWELSTARASSVLRTLMERDGLPASRGAAAGYADQRPLVKNDSPEDRARNRRVEIVVQAAVSDPGVADSTTPQADAATATGPLLDLSAELATSTAKRASRSAAVTTVAPGPTPTVEAPAPTPTTEPQTAQTPTAPTATATQTAQTPTAATTAAPTSPAAVVTPTTAGSTH